jgi:hypothetical protein
MGGCTACVRPVRETTAPLDVPSPGAIAWLDVSSENPDTWSPPSTRANARRRTGPLGMEISPLRHARVPYLFKGARLRGTRCIWSASTVSGAELFRPARTSAPPPFDQGVHIVARMDGTGAVFELGDCVDGTMRVFEPADEIAEQFLTNTHLFTLNIPLAAIGIEASAVREMSERIYELTPFHSQLLRGAVGLILTGGEELAVISRRSPDCCCERQCDGRVTTSRRSSSCGSAPTRSSSSMRPTRT